MSTSLILKVVPFDKNLLLNWKYDGIEKEFAGEHILPIVEFYAKMGNCYIGMVGDKVLGVAGMYPLWENAGSCFLLINKEASHYKKSIFKYLLDYTKRLIEQYKIKNLILECQSESFEATNLIVHLGFRKVTETKMMVYTRI
jgi:hypothetical protein